MTIAKIKKYKSSITKIKVKTKTRELHKIQTLQEIQERVKTNTDGKICRFLKL